MQGITALEAGNDALLCIFGRHHFDLPGYPGVIGIHQSEARHVIFPVGVETGGDEQHLRLEGVERGQPDFTYRCAESLAAAVGRQRGGDDVRVAAVGAAVWVERVLEAGAEHYPRIVMENVFRAVAVVHVEVGNGDPLQAVMRQPSASGPISR